MPTKNTDSSLHLVTNNTKPLHQLEQHLINKEAAIESWFHEQWKLYPPPFTSSVDLRNAGFKLAPIDTNLFPAGFNNLNPDFFPACAKSAQKYITQTFPNCQRILIVAESHTRNFNYFESLAILQRILQQANFDVRIGSLLTQLTDAETISLHEQQSITLHPIEKKDGKLRLKDFEPCLILLNNDLSEGIPDILQNIQQPIHPPA